MSVHTRLGAADLARIKGELNIQRDSLKNQINAELSRNEQQQYAQVMDSVRDRGDESVFDLYSDLALASIQSHVERLQAVENAINRIREDKFGLCVDCKKPINQARLDADPVVPRCIQCQTRIESAPGAGDATPSL